MMKLKLICSVILLLAAALLISGCTTSAPAASAGGVSLTVLEITKHYTTTEGECYWDVQVEIKNPLDSRATDVQAWVKLLEKGDGSVKDKAAINVDSIGAGETKLFTKKLYGDCGTEYDINAYIDS